MLVVRKKWFKGVSERADANGELINAHQQTLLSLFENGPSFV